MTRKSAIALAIILVVLASSLSVLLLNYPVYSSTQTVSPDNTSLVTGYIVVFQNGTVGGTAASAVAHVYGSNVYNMTSDVIGNITIERTGANFNGNGFSLFNSSLPVQPLVNISNANDVSFGNLNINASSAPDFMFTNTSYDKISNSTMSTTFENIIIAGNTSYIDFSNSILYQNYTGSELAAIASGFNPYTPTPLNSSHNTFSNLTLIANVTTTSAGMPVVVILSPYTSFENSSITIIGSPQIAIGVGTNDTSLQNNRIVMEQNGVGINAGFSGVSTSLFATKNNSIENNRIILDNSTIFLSAIGNGGIQSNSQGIISGNVITGNYTGGIYGIMALQPNTTISNNYVNLNTSRSLAASEGIVGLNSSVSVLQNTILLSGFYTYGVFEGALSGVSNFTGVNIENNTILANGSGESYGILQPEGYSSNSMVSSNDISSTGTDALGIAYTGNDTSLISNQVTVKSNANSAASSGGIVFGIGTTTHNVNISGNVLHVSASNYSDAMTVVDVNYSTLSNNNVQQDLAFGTNESSLLALVGTNHTSVYGNTFNSEANYSAFALLMAMSQNDTFYSNTFSGASGLFNFTGANNSLFYHNNFLRYNDYGNSTNSTGNLFNATYPVGGNYWGTSVTLTDTHSGPGQNLPGSDGIGDSPVTTVVGVDHYPLMYQWNSPTVTFTESGLPANQAWTFVFNGMTYTTSSQSKTVSIINGTYQNYSYSAAGTTQYYLQQANGSIAYSGSSLTVDLTYTHYAYLSGSITPGTFTLYLNGTAVLENSTNFNLSIRAGTYELKVVSPGYSPYYENFTVAANQTKQLDLNFTNTSSGNGGIPMQYIYYAAGGVAAIAVLGGVAFGLRRRNVGK